MESCFCVAAASWSRSWQARACICASFSSCCVKCEKSACCWSASTRSCLWLSRSSSHLRPSAVVSEPSGGRLVSTSSAAICASISAASVTSANCFTPISSTSMWCCISACLMRFSLFGVSHICSLQSSSSSSSVPVCAPEQSFHIAEEGRCAELLLSLVGESVITWPCLSSGSRHLESIASTCSSGEPSRGSSSEFSVARLASSPES
mmetsp:Transcript_26194/g.57408  ORF Transcript_26194/g.57408 Transcript_26194/m.57408 type:complete len:207 (+) Transcript_26194:55-675(+)